MEKSFPRVLLYKYLFYAASLHYRGVIYTSYHGWLRLLHDNRTAQTDRNTWREPNLKIGLT